MKVAIRARELVAKGADPRAAADQTVPSPRYKKMAARDRRVRAATHVGVVASIVIGGWATGFHRPTPAETVRQHQLAEAGLGPDQILPTDIRTRLEIPPQDVASLTSLLRIAPQVEPDMTWQAVLDGRSTLPTALPAREDALRSLIDSLASLGSAERREAIMQFRVEAGLTPIARSLVQALNDVPPAELPHLLPLLVSIMRLPIQQRAALESAGFPAVPVDVSRQDLYQRLGRISTHQASFVDAYLKEPERWDALLRISHLLQAPIARRILGGIADGVVSFTDNPRLPVGCDIGSPSSCKSRP